MRIALVFLAGMAFVVGFNKHARSLDEKSKEMIQPATVEEFAAYKQRWQANLRTAQRTLPQSAK